MIGCSREGLERGWITGALPARTQGLGFEWKRERKFLSQHGDKARRVIILTCRFSLGLIRTGVSGLPVIVTSIPLLETGVAWRTYLCSANHFPTFGALTLYLLVLPVCSVQLLPFYYTDTHPYTTYFPRTPSSPIYLIRAFSFPLIYLRFLGTSTNGLSARTVNQIPISHRMIITLTPLNPMKLEGIEVDDMCVIVY